MQIRQNEGTIDPICALPYVSCVEADIHVAARYGRRRRHRLWRTWPILEPTFLSAKYSLVTAKNAVAVMPPRDPASVSASIGCQASCSRQILSDDSNQAAARSAEWTSFGSSGR